MNYASKFKGMCKVCRKAIEVGELISKADKQGWIHFTCKAKDCLVTTMPGFFDEPPDNDIVTELLDSMTVFLAKTAPLRKMVREAGEPPKSTKATSTPERPKAVSGRDRAAGERDD